MLGALLQSLHDQNNMGTEGKISAMGDNWERLYGMTPDYDQSCKPDENKHWLLLNICNCYGCSVRVRK